MRPPDKEYGKSEGGVWWRGEVGSEAAFVSGRSMNSSPQSPALFSGSDFSNGFQNERVIDKCGQEGQGSAECSFLNGDSWF